MTKRNPINQPCPLCQMCHPTPAHKELCEVRMRIINWKLRERELLEEIRLAEAGPTGTQQQPIHVISGPAVVE